VTIEWIALDTVLTFHRIQIEEHGGARGIRDQALLESAMARPRNLAAYQQADLYHLAAAYAWGLARDHPFVDGNKRTAFVVAATFLELNGRRLIADEADAASTFLRLAEGMSEDALADWFRRHSE